MLQLIGEELQPVDEAAVDDHRLGGQVVYNMAQDAALVGDVHRNLQGAHVAQRAEDGDEIDRVRQHRQHSIASLDAERGQAVREFVR